MDDDQADIQNMIEAWRHIMLPGRTWVLFSNGTCVVVREPDIDPAVQAVALLKEHGPVHAGTPSGDFNVHELDDNRGWVVTFDHPDILAHVGVDDIESDAPEVAIGIRGRTIRLIDADELQVVHVQGNS